MIQLDDQALETVAGGLEWWQWGLIGVAVVATGGAIGAAVLGGGAAAAGAAAAGAGAGAAKAGAAKAGAATIFSGSVYGLQQASANKYHS